MKRFYNVTFALMFIGLVILCLHAPWTQTQPATSDTHPLLGYATIWSHQFTQFPGAHVEWGAFSLYAAGIAFFSIVIGFIANSFREDRGKLHHDKSHRDKPESH